MSNSALLKPDPASRAKNTLSQAEHVAGCTADYQPAQNTKERLPCGSLETWPAVQGLHGKEKTDLGRVA